MVSIRCSGLSQSSSRHPPANAACTCSTSAVGREYEFELYVFFGPESVNRITKHHNEFVERPPLRRYATALEHASYVPFVFPVDGHMIELHDISVLNCSQSTFASSAIPRTVPRLSSLCRGIAISVPSSLCTIVCRPPSRTTQKPCVRRALRTLRCEKLTGFTPYAG
jgi:hypothetical protein